MDMRKALLEFNRELAEKGRTAINFGVGVHSEDMILGVVGNEARLAVTVVSSGVDLANRLEAATKEHHVAQVLSEPAWQGLSEDLKARFRHLGEILHLGESIAIYGMSDGLPES
jgi:class 3 adenylate cyclase